MKQYLEERIAYLKNIEREKLDYIDKVPLGPLRSTQWELIREIGARKNELQNALRFWESAQLQQHGVMQGLPTEEELWARLQELPYTKHLDDGQYNDGVIDGFEQGVRWVMSKLSSSPTVGQRSGGTATCGVDDNGWQCQKTTEPGGVASQCMNGCVLAGSSCEG